MYKSLLLLCLVGVVWAQKTKGLEDLINQIFKNNLKFTENTVNNVIKPVTIGPLVSRPQDMDYQPCTTDDGEEGQCVSYYLCDDNHTIIKDGITTIDIRFANGCPSYLDVCCIISDKVVSPITPSEIPKKGCGWRNPDGVGFKTIGDRNGESQFGEFPWMVAILKIEPVNDVNPYGQKLNVYVGGGSLIHPAVVLTTAHYVVTTKTRKVKVRAGEWDTQTRKEIYPYQDRDVDSISVHEDFNTKRKNLFYDIALLFLSSPMDTSIPNVVLACLPPPNQRTRGGETCVASGWGKEKFGRKGRYQVILKKVTMPVVERNQCQTQLRKTRLGHFFELHSTFMCAGGEAGIDTCKGDGGSPLMCPIENEPNRYMQSGMVAWGIGCGDKGVPGVYVDVSFLRDWIDDKIADKGLDTTVYTI